MAIEKVLNKENNDILYLIPNKPSRFIEGEEFVCVKREPIGILEFYIKRKSLIRNVK